MPDIDEFFSSQKEIKLQLAAKFPSRGMKFSQLDKHHKDELIKKCLENKELLSAFPQSSTPSPGLLLHLACLQARSFEHERPLV